jgi:hypothetical protein
VSDYIITPAAEACGFTTLRADQITHPGIITDQVIQHLIEDPMVVADLTGRNPNVFYELAIRHAIRRPYVQIIEETEDLPFDVFGIRTIRFTYRYIDSLNMAKAEMVKQMNSLLSGDAQVTSPVTTAVALSTLKHSDKPIDRQFAEVLTAIAELKQQVGSLQREATVASLAASSPYTGYTGYSSVAPEEAMKLVNDLVRRAAGANLLINPYPVSSDPIEAVKPSICISGKS